MKLTPTWETKKTRTLIRFVFFTNVILAFHFYFPLYINSSFLSQFFTSTTIDGLYTVAALLTLMVLISSAKLIKTFGLHQLMLIGTLIEACALFGLALSPNILWLKIFFIFHQTLPPLLLFGLDIFLESLTTNEGRTGSIRSIYLTLNNTALVITPFIVGKIVSMSSYQFIYIIAAFFCLILFLILHEKLRTIKVHKPNEINFLKEFKKFIAHEDLTVVFILNFLLQCFYAIMVIYTPLYLYSVIGFSWANIGIIFTIMLIPFVIFEAPLGQIFDKVGRVKTILALGFLIMSAILGCIYTLTVASFAAWATLLFCSRVGASFVEMGTEYSFFKRVTDRDAGFISIYRMAAPCAYIVAPFIALFLHTVFPVQHTFLALSLVMLLGVAFTYLLKDK